MPRYKQTDEINKLRADTYQSYQAGRLSEQRATEIDKLLGEKEEAIRLGNELKVAELDEYLSVMFPAAGGGTEEAAMKASDLAGLMAAQAGKSDLPERKFLTAQEQQAVEIEQTILESPKSEAAMSQYQDFNRYSNRPRIALRVGKKIVMFNLPKIGGKIITARQVYEAAEKVNMSVEDYVTKVLGIPEAKEALGVERPGAGGGF